MWSKMLSNLGSAARSLGGAGRTAAIGATAGGAYGAVASDTSVVGGAMMGASLGLGGRYARAGARSASKYMAGPSSMSGIGRAFAGGIQRRAQRDMGGAVLRGNRAYNSIASSLKNWRT